MCFASTTSSMKTAPTNTTEAGGGAPVSFDTKLKKCAIVVRDLLANGTQVNTGVVAGISLGKLCSEMVGRDLPDSSGYLHHGITTIPIPILKADAAFLKELRSRAKAYEPELIVVDVISATRATKSYDEYAAVLETISDDEIDYFGIALYGDKKIVARLTGSLPLLR